jgi:hypothetical protein
LPTASELLKSVKRALLAKGASERAIWASKREAEDREDAHIRCEPLSPQNMGVTFVAWCGKMLLDDPNGLTPRSAEGGFACHNP